MRRKRGRGKTPSQVTNFSCMKVHFSVMFVSKKTPELLNQLQASIEEMYNTGAIIAMLPWNSRVTCVHEGRRDS